jgi:hypothetical protein
VTRLYVRVLLDTGPTEEETDQLQRMFRSLGMDAEVEGHSYGGPPPTSAFLIVVNAPLVPLLDVFVAFGSEGPARLERWARELLGLRADARRWGRPHSLILEDAHTGLELLLPPELPTEAFAAALEIDLSGFDRSSPPVTVQWNRRMLRWQAYPRVASRRIARRLPVRTRTPTMAAVGVRELSGGEIRELWRLIDEATVPAITWQRARIVLWSALGWNPTTIAGKLLLSEPRVRAVIDNFNLDGFASLDPGYLLGPSAQLLPAERQEAGKVAGSPPADYGLSVTAWTADSLAEFLVTEGLVEDVSTGQLAALLQDVDVASSR